HSIAVRDLAVDGETTGSFVSDYFSSASSRSQLARAVAAIRSHGGRIGPVTLDIGGNDALNVRGPNHSRAEKLAALTTIRANLEAIVSTLQSELQVATSPGELVLLAYYEPYGDDDPDLWAMGRLNQTIADVGREYGLRVAEPYAAFVGVERQTTWMSCRCVIDIHPNDRGYDLIGDALASVTIGPAAADGNVVGVVRDATGAPVAGASVWYGGASVLTAADGSYRFNGVPAGVTLRFEAGDASNADLDGASLTLAPGQSVIQNFVLSVSDSGMALQSSASTRGVAGFARIGAAIVQAAGRAAAQAAHDRAAADLSRAKTGAAGLAGKATAAIAHLRRQIP
ncbi:MAG TPA: GDSL-type esterase/lipase family protein, partial [Dehalococcoidia bacterium]